MKVYLKRVQRTASKIEFTWIPRRMIETVLISKNAIGVGFYLIFRNFKSNSRNLALKASSEKILNIRKKAIF